ncbi:hypothetical protein AB6A40_006745 [Gnathostoma spinigerum]|uniref:Uncharacterized protein n=1 Tax=Gnathostoma spinigerum TaxID=75299 RepID=A0ABD6ERG6_9BILA
MERVTSVLSIIFVLLTIASGNTFREGPPFDDANSLGAALAEINREDRRNDAFAGDVFPAYFLPQKRVALPLSGGLYGKRNSWTTFSDESSKRTVAPLLIDLYGKRTAIPLSGGFFGKRGVTPFQGSF